MNTEQKEGASLRPLIFTRYPTKATWKEHFYDGETMAVEGRITYYKPHWIMELMANRGYTYEPEVEAEPSAAEQIAAQTSGQEPAADDKPNRPKRSKREVNDGK